MLPYPLPSTSIAMLLADARLPSGGHAHSAGVEPALRAGMDPAQIPALLHTRAWTGSLVDAGTAVVARHLALTADADALTAAETAWAARTPSPAQRDAARVLGRGLLRLGTHLWPESHPLASLGRRPTPAPRAVVLGVIAAEAGMDPLDLCRTVVYDDAASAAAAVLKLEPGDPAAASVWVAHTCAAVDDALRPISELTDSRDIPVAGAPESEQWAESHALLTQRLFRA
ncbi:urease accessory protein UreF [Microbacterium sp. ZW T6_19]|uniref:urease accessory protein UreF n=1 Tax=Microbacterium sp. ZW T6_19 TaxID=3378082 RepID=UPI003854D134